MFTRIAHRPIANMDNIALHMRLTAGVCMGVEVVYTCRRLAIVVISDGQSTAFIWHRINQTNRDVTTSVAMDSRSPQTARVHDLQLRTYGKYQRDIFFSNVAKSIIAIEQQILMSNDDDVPGPCETAVVQNLMFRQFFDIPGKKGADINITKLLLKSINVHY